MTTTNQLDAAGRLAYAQAVYKLVGAAVKTNTPGNLRAALDAESLELYAAHGAKNRDLRIGSTKVGTLSLTVESRAQVCDADEWHAWMVDTGRGVYREVIDTSMLSNNEVETIVALAKSVNPLAVRSTFVELTPDWTKGLEDGGGGLVVDGDGCVVPGTRWVERVKSSSVRGCEPEKVAKALRGIGAPTDVFGMLEPPEEPLSADVEVLG